MSNKMPEFNPFSLLVQVLEQKEDKKTLLQLAQKQSILFEAWIQQVEYQKRESTSLKIKEGNEKHLLPLHYKPPESSKVLIDHFDIIQNGGEPSDQQVIQTSPQRTKPVVEKQYNWALIICIIVLTSMGLVLGLFKMYEGMTAEKIFAKSTGYIKQLKSYLDSLQKLQNFTENNSTNSVLNGKLIDSQQYEDTHNESASAPESQLPSQTEDTKNEKNDEMFEVLKKSLEKITQIFEQHEKQAEYNWVFFFEASLLLLTAIKDLIIICYIGVKEKKPEQMMTIESSRKNDGSGLSSNK